MSNNTNALGTTQVTGRGFMWLGIVVTLLGVVTYAALLIGAQLLHMPWYAPLLAIVGVGLTFIAVRRKPGVWRYAALFFCCLLVIAEVWFLFSYTKLPKYAGPAVTGQPFPEFTTRLVDNTVFTNNDFVGQKNTALVFYRGHW